MISNTARSVEPVDAPKPILRRSRWPFPWIWIVPLLALLGAGYYFYLLYERNGTVITISFPDTSGMKIGETPVTVHGVKVGTVVAVSLADDESHAVVKVRLQHNADPVARTGTLFWLVRPGLVGGNIIGLGTIVTGPYIEALPGPGAQARDFQGVDKPPVIRGDGIKVILHAARVEHSQVNSPVYYRGIQVGTIQDIRLASDSTQVNLTLFIWHRYQKLLKTTSQFYAINAAEIKGDLFSGLQLELGSLREQLGAGVSFATPADGAPAVEGTEFLLYDKPNSDWLRWTPQIDYHQPELTGQARDISHEQSGLRSTVRVK